MLEWLRVGKRIEHVLLVLCIVSFLMFAIPAIVYRDMYAADTLDLLVLLVCIAGFSLTLYVPALVYVRLQRRKRESTSAEAHALGRRPAAPRRIYIAMAAVTVMSATYEANYLTASRRSEMEVFLWNIAALLLAIGLLELQRWRIKGR